MLCTCEFVNKNPSRIHFDFLVIGEGRKFREGRVTDLLKLI